jgi:uncharacterized membrane protein YhaH (DUF805 family)
MEKLHWFLDPIEKHYFDFEGRVTRQTFWMFALWACVISIGIGIVGGMAGMPMLGSLFNLAILLPGLGLGARRLHDTGMSGWWQVVGFVPLIGWLIIIVMLAQQGKTGPNEYGPDPRQTTGSVPVPPAPEAPTTAQATEVPPAPVPSPETTPAPAAPDSEQKGGM